MKSEWKVSSNYIGEWKMYGVYRLLDTREVDHAGNREYSDLGYVGVRSVAQAEAERLNALDKENARI